MVNCAVIIRVINKTKFKLNPWAQQKILNTKIGSK